ncbi:hypothetical protein Cph01nite_10580 [Cellulomonas phragmiteti]|uniref:Uncharacterized protein n=1 Tax=Cellulomonas phragmiteti TaxID=478780 RepID=A0ABQ4DIY1_9CELL|nr:hypothetical protein Cph01nite_10580 [Cellulomonas phragmiteti]
MRPDARTGAGGASVRRTDEGGGAMGLVSTLFKGALLKRVLDALTGRRRRA